MRWIRPLTAQLDEPLDVVGAKAHGLVTLHRLGLPVPPGVVVTSEACRAFLSEGRLPDGLREELGTAIGELEAATGRQFGGAPPLAVSVRSGASVSMPGMMNTILDLGLTTKATTALATETGDIRFALNSRLRFLSTFASALTGIDLENTNIDARAATGRDIHNEQARLTSAIAAFEENIERRSGRAIPDDPIRQLELAVEAVFASWNAPRAHTYRELHGIGHDLGTAVIVQAMVFGNRDDHSGTGVAFSRDPNTGEHTPYGDVLFSHQGEDVLSGRSLTLRLHELGPREPSVWAALTNALTRIENHYRDACYVEFTFQARKFWLLQTRPGRFIGAAAVRLAVDLADEQTITRSEALLRVSPRDLQQTRIPRIADPVQADILARGVGASPGVAVGRVATTTEASICMAPEGATILARPETSPNDINGLAAAAGIITARGGAASHAAVVARTMSKPAVVGITDLTINNTDATIQIAGRTIPEGTLVTVDGTSGLVALSSPPTATDTSSEHLWRLLTWADDISGNRSARDDAQRLETAHTALLEA